MSTFVLVPGAGGMGWYWHLLVPELERLGHEAIAVDIREDDPRLGLPEYADIVVDAIGDRSDVVLVGQSLGAFTVPVVAWRVPVRMIVLLNAMIPLPGETPGEWWGATGQPQARELNDKEDGRSGEFDEEVHFLHDVPPDVVAAGAGEQREPSDTPFGQPCEMERWPDVPTKVLIGQDDRFFPLDFQRSQAKERLRLVGDEIRGGHLVALSNPVELAARLDEYSRESDPGSRVS
ncbi:alpha/beta fold hydrolase [Arthrobacter sp. M4]|uniref:alpha/beta fold hydrolase n=1 Tax=Arthrobacter sp. M4 TaxID=218160 RepID=UPI001CDBDEB2|nr:alpha/beta fold hydrolase [Arthrobacter sp. M4]MCA4134052.1 alpha/beta hydrolase [Arthrobacter sp. M4]